MSFLPELKAEAKIACGCFIYLLAKGYKADTGKIIKVAAKASKFIWFNTIKPPQRLRKRIFAASYVLTYPDARGRVLHLSTFLSNYLSR